MTRPPPELSHPDDAVVEVTLARLGELYGDPASGLHWPCPFVLPPWLSAWSSTLGRDAVPCLREIRRGDALLGVAPLSREGESVRFLGSPEVCDYHDVIVAPGCGRELFGALLTGLRREGIRRLDLGPVRPDSVVAVELVPLARELGLPLVVEPEGVDVQLALPPTEEAFLRGLDKKSRHEIRRKLRRLATHGTARFRRVVDPTPADGEVFLRLFRANRPDKAAFLTPEVEAYFRALLAATARAGLLDLSFLEIEGRPAAAVLCFAHASTTYLYNNAYDRHYEALSVGILSKVMSIQESIRRGHTRYDLLKGEESYKFRLGGEAVPLLRCRVELP